MDMEMDTHLLGILVQLHSLCGGGELTQWARTSCVLPKLWFHTVELYLFVKERL